MLQTDMGTVPVMLLSIGLLFLGFVLGWLVSTKLAHSKIHRAEADAAQTVEDAKADAESLKRTSILEARDEMHQERITFEREIEGKWDEVKTQETRLNGLDRQLEKRADLLNHKETTILQREEELVVQEEDVEKRSTELETTLTAQTGKLEQIAQMTKQNAIDTLVSNLEEEARTDASWRIKEIRDEALTKANEEAREIISNAIQRLASDHTVESTVDGGQAAE